MNQKNFNDLVKECAEELKKSDVINIRQLNKNLVKMNNHFLSRCIDGNEVMDSIDSLDVVQKKIEAVKLGTELAQKLNKGFVDSHETD